MTHAKEKPLIPITREFLRQFYQKYPLEPVSAQARLTHLDKIAELVQIVTRPGSKAVAQFDMPNPTRIDDCFWRNRMICEELALSISQLHASLTSQPEVAAVCDRCHALLVSAERGIFAVQEHNTASVKAQLQQFIPQDFRGALLERQRVGTEARYRKQVNDLVKRGGTIRQKYDLYLQQQWERRQALVQLGECSGMYKVVIKWVAGIPQVLLDFAKEINAKLGPMEEQRIKYGPDLYGITELGIRLDVCIAAWVEAAVGHAHPEAVRAIQPRLVDCVEPAIGFYCEQMLRVIRHIGDVFQHSPFFVNQDDLAVQGTVDDGEVVVKDDLQQKQIHLQLQAAMVDAECGSSTLSAVSASGDYGTALSPSSAPLSQLPSVVAPPTPGLPLEVLSLGSLGLSVCMSAASYGGRTCPEATSQSFQVTELHVQQQQQGYLCSDSSPVALPTTTTAAPISTCNSALVGTITSMVVPSLTQPHPHGAMAITHPLISGLTPSPGAADSTPATATDATADSSAAAASTSLCLSAFASASSSLKPVQSASHVTLRLHLSTESHASFLSALEYQPWHDLDEGSEEPQQTTSPVLQVPSLPPLLQQHLPQPKQHLQVSESVQGSQVGLEPTTSCATAAAATAFSSGSGDIAEARPFRRRTSWFAGCFGRAPSASAGSRQLLRHQQPSVGASLSLPQSHSLQQPL